MVNNGFLDIELLTDYLDGKLDAKTMNRIEREALEDPFVAEALAGLSDHANRSVQSLSILQKQLAERIAIQEQHKKAAVITWQRLSIAATAAVLFVTVSIVFWMREENRRKHPERAPVEVNIAPRSTTALPLAPVIGLANYTTWLNKHNKLIGKEMSGKFVTLRFHIDAKGRPADIRIVKGLSNAYNQEAMRLLAAAPDWESSADQAEDVLLNIGF